MQNKKSIRKGDRLLFQSGLLPFFEKEEKAGKKRGLPLFPKK
jgi:hypothetical protein